MRVGERALEDLCVRVEQENPVGIDRTQRAVVGVGKPRFAHEIVLASGNSRSTRGTVSSEQPAATTTTSNSTSPARSNTVVRHGRSQPALFAETMITESRFLRFAISRDLPHVSTKRERPYAPETPRTEVETERPAAERRGALSVPNSNRRWSRRRCGRCGRRCRRRRSR